MTNWDFDEHLTPCQDGQILKSVGENSSPQLQPSVAFVRPCELPSRVLLDAQIRRERGVGKLFHRDVGCQEES